MYFPYLRGKQFELIALRELVEKGLLSDKVIPVVEPVKLSSTLVKTLEVYGQKRKQIAFITNPAVGGFQDDLGNPQNRILRDNLETCLYSYRDTMIFMYILNSQSDPGLFIEKHAERMGTICEDKDSVAVYEQYFSGKAVKFNLIPDDRGIRRKIRQNRVLLDDKFNKKLRNNDYIDRDDEPFSDDHLYYREDHFVGFSDYSVIGREYSETGFAPYAVAIHIVYFDTDQSLRVKHFVSDSNDDISDPAGKFQEALSKLVAWNRKMKLDTAAMSEFENLYRTETYPGLGTVKKLSIMHHLELIGGYLDKE
jgi:hypothetical protein